MSPPQVMALIVLLAVLAAACVLIVVALSASRIGVPVKAAMIGGTLAIVAAVWGPVVPIVILGGQDEDPPSSTLGATLRATPTPEDTPGGPGGKIVFDSDRDGDREIYVMDADGGNPTRLTDNTAADRDPAWSPDGSRIALDSDRDGNREIYVMVDANGANPTNLTQKGKVYLTTPSVKWATRDGMQRPPANCSGAKKTTPNWR